MTAIYATIALLIGLVIGFLVAKVKSNALRVRGEVLASKLAGLEKATQEALEEKDKNHAKLMAERKASYEQILSERDREAQLDHERQEKHNREALDVMQRRFDATVDKMKAELETLTAELLKRRQQEFEAANSESMTRIVEPLKNQISEMQKVVADNTLRHTEYGGKLDANIRMMLEHSDAARQSADRLAKALRGGGKVQGDWGESVLAELLTSQGLTEGVHFETQPTMRDEAGNSIRSESDSRLRPDVLLHLDKQRVVVIDAKVSLSAYLDYKNAETDEVRERALNDHIASVEKHWRELSKKNYSAYMPKGCVSVNYVIMFVPNSSALFTATSHKPDLWRSAMESGVYIADEQTLYAALKIIDMTWRQIAQAENHEKVYKLADEMLDRVSLFMERFMKIGKGLEDARKMYDDAYAKLKEGGQSIPGTCQKLRGLGARVTPRKGVPPELLGEAVVE